MITIEHDVGILDEERVLFQTDAEYARWVDFLTRHASAHSSNGEVLKNIPVLQHHFFFGGSIDVDEGDCKLKRDFAGAQIWLFRATNKSDDEALQKAYRLSYGS